MAYEWDEEMRAWAYLSRVVEGPSRQLNALLAAGHGPAEIAHGVYHQKSWIGALQKETASRHLWNRALEDLQKAEDWGIRLIHPGHEEWPSTELDIAFGFAEAGMSPHIRTYQTDAVAPHTLWLRGQGNLKELSAQAVGIVGTRSPTAYGRTVSTALAQGLARHHWTVVSGGAIGIDAIAHNSALEAGGSTIAVAACGLDRDYPRKNSDLFVRIAERGVHISEYPVETTPQRHRFLTRNRLVAALSQGTVVVQAAWRSGALNTLSWAEGLGRVAMAVPGPVTEAASRGCHERIREGAAQLVTSADDVRGLLSAVGTLDVQQQYELQFGPHELQGLTRNELRIFDATDPLIAKKSEVIAQESGLSIPLTVHLLVQLQQRGLVYLEKDSWQRSSQD